MRKAIPFLAVALALFVVGAGLWTIGRFEQRLVNARQQVLTLDYATPLPEYDRLEQAISLLERIPWIADRIAYIHALRAASKYWQRDYAPLALKRDSGGALIGEDPTIVRFAANAAFRSARVNVNDRAASQRLNEVLAIYAEALRHDPQFDVAFNYELVARARDALTRRGSNRLPPGRGRTDAHADPSEQTIHGRPGRPPEQTDMRDFKIIIPQRTDERAQQPDAGVGGKKPRKG